MTHGHYYGVSMAFDQLADAAKQRGCNAAVLETDGNGGMDVEIRYL